MNTDIVGAWVGVVEKCGARTAATRMSVSGNLGDLFDIVSHRCMIKSVVMKLHISLVSVVDSSVSGTVLI